MRRHHTIDYSIRAPAIMWRVVKVRAIRLDDFFQMFDSTHFDLPVNPETRFLLLAAGWHTRDHA
jgi:hypothetical protein